MTIDAAGWVDWATRDPGPSNKVFDARNQANGLVLHSMEGWWGGSRAEMLRQTRQASWHFSNLLSGELIQSYPLTASCWASGNFEANTRFVAMELEGLADMPINDDQLRTTLRLFADLEAWGLKLTRGTSEADRTLWMHREVATRWFPNAGPTGCPSDRYARLFEALEDDMSAIDEIKGLVVGNGIDVEADASTIDLFPAGTDEGATVRLTGEQAWQYAVRKGWSLGLGLGLVRRDVAAIKAGGPTGGIPEHTHEIGGVKA